MLPWYPLFKIKKALWLSRKECLSIGIVLFCLHNYWVITCRSFCRTAWTRTRSLQSVQSQDGSSLLLCTLEAMEASVLLAWQAESQPSSDLRSPQACRIAGRALCKPPQNWDELLLESQLCFPIHIPFHKGSYLNLTSDKISPAKLNIKVLPLHCLQRIEVEVNCLPNVKIPYQGQNFSSVW